MARRRMTTSAPAKKASRKGMVKVAAKSTAKQATARKAAPKQAAAPSQATVLLNDLRPSVDALHDRVEKLRHR